MWPEVLRSLRAPASPRWRSSCSGGALVMIVESEDGLDVKRAFAAARRLAPARRRMGGADEVACSSRRRARPPASGGPRCSRSSSSISPKATPSPAAQPALDPAGLIGTDARADPGLAPALASRPDRRSSAPARSSAPRTCPRIAGWAFPWPASSTSIAIARARPRDAVRASRDGVSRRSTKRGDAARCRFRRRRPRRSDRRRSSSGCRTEPPC